MNLTYAAKLGSISQKTHVGVQKIDGSRLALVTYGIVIAGFSFQDKLGRV